MSKIIWLVFLIYGALGALAVLYLHLLVPRALGARRDRFENFLVGVISVLLTVTAAMRSYLAWYVAIAFCVYHLLDVVLRRNIMFGTDVSTRMKGLNVAWIVMNSLLLLTLFSTAGREAFMPGLHS